MPHIIEDGVNARISVQHGAEVKPVWLPREPSELGLAGDGVQDDTATLAALIAGGGEIYLPAGRYKIRSTVSSDGTIFFVSDTVLVGDPTGGTIIELEPTVDRGRGFWMNGISNVVISNIKLQITAQGPTDPVQYGVYINNCTNMRFDNFEVEGPGQNALNGVEAYECVYVTGGTSLFRMVDCYIHSAENTYGLEIAGLSDALFERCRFNSNGWDGVKLLGAGNDQITFNRCELSDNGRAALDHGHPQGNGNGVDVGAGTNIKFNICKAYRNEGPQYQVKTTSSGPQTVSDIQFIGCVANDGFSNGFGVVEDSTGLAPYISRVLFMGCVANGNDASGFNISASMNTQVIDCAAASNEDNGLVCNTRNQAAGRDVLGLVCENFVASGNCVNRDSYGVVIRGRNGIIRNCVVSGVDAPAQGLIDESTFQANSRNRGIWIDGESTSFLWTSEADSDSAPASGAWNKNAGQTIVRVHDTDEGATDRTAWLVQVLTFDKIWVQDNAAPTTNWQLYQITSVTDQTTHYEFGVTLISEAGTIAAATSTSIRFPIMHETLIDGLMLQWSFNSWDLRVSNGAEADIENFALQGAGSGAGFQNSRYSTH